MKTVVPALLLLTASVFANAQALPPHPKECGDPVITSAINRITADWKAGYNADDPDKVAALYADDATYLTQHFVSGIVHGRRAIRAYVKNGTSAGYKIDSIEVLSSDCSGNFAYAITRYRSTNGGQAAMGVNVVVLKKIKSKWLIVAHESAVPDPSTAIQKLDVQ